VCSEEIRDDGFGPAKEEGCCVTWANACCAKAYHIDCVTQDVDEHVDRETGIHWGDWYYKCPGCDVTMTRRRIVTLLNRMRHIPLPDEEASDLTKPLLGLPDLEEAVDEEGVPADAEQSSSSCVVL